MQKRRSHTKSRRGCRACKQQHIKCDEQGPPCANCVARSTTCTYANPGPSKARSSGKPAIPRELPPRLVPESSGSRRLLELELMHRWTTRTYLGNCSIPQDRSLLQIGVPRKSLQFDCLLNGVFALASLDLAITAPAGGEESAMYGRVAMEYYQKSLRSMREEMNNITIENHDSIFLLAVGIGIINIAALHVPRDDGQLPSVLEQMPTVFDLFRGSTMVSLRCARWLMESTESLRIVVALGEASPDLLDADTRSALAQLESVNDRLHISAVCQAGHAPEREVAAHQMYRRALSALKRCFAEDARGLIDGFLMALPAYAGRQFASAIKKSDPMALLILMYFGVLLEEYGKKAWWAPTIGKRLILEISEKLERISFTLVPGFREAMTWARQQVGLPVLIEATILYRPQIVEISGDV